MPRGLGRYSNAMGATARIWAFVHFAFAVASSRKATQIVEDVVFTTTPTLAVALHSVDASRCLNAPMGFEVRDHGAHVVLQVCDPTTGVMAFAAPLSDPDALISAAALLTGRINAASNR